MIICECGHGIDAHYLGELGNCELCECCLSDEAVEARYWARRLMKERDALLKEVIWLIDDYENKHRVLFTYMGAPLEYWNKLKIERDTLLVKLDEAIEAMKRAKTELWGMPGKADHILEDAMKKIRGEK